MRRLLVVAVLLLSACDPADRVTSGGSALLDSARSAAVSTDFGAPVDPDDWIGLEVPPYPPAGVESLAAGLWYPGGEAASRAEWRVDHVRVGGRPMLWLMSVTRRVEEPIMRDGVRVGTRSMPHWKVRDAVALPRYGEDERVNVSRCRGAGGRRAAVVGSGWRESGEIAFVRAAWALEEGEGRLVELDPAAVRC